MSRGIYEGDAAYLSEEMYTELMESIAAVRFILKGGAISLAEIEKICEEIGFRSAGFCKSKTWHSFLSSRYGSKIVIPDSFFF